MNKFLPAIGRVFIAQIFFISIILTIVEINSTVNGYQIYQEQLMSKGLYGIFAPISILVQLVFGLSLLVGYKTRVSSLALTIYSLLLSFIYFNIGNLLLSLQYIAITGGLIILIQNPVTIFALDNVTNTKKRK
jgi:putative oxidoreductase